jgi:hypothetical protein
MTKEQPTEAGKSRDYYKLRPKYEVGEIRVWTSNHGKAPIANLTNGELTIVYNTDPDILSYQLELRGDCVKKDLHFKEEGLERVLSKITKLVALKPNIERILSAEIRSPAARIGKTPTA